ncbi:hypothetical protein KEM55_002229 [Ascosphaera atra]|nr:hypothetical protein KEM55_002229 [Ascosphaera atra]
MWVLSAAGYLLNGKRLWLRPGKTYLFGRVKGDGVVALVDNPTVSRRHLTLTISSVKPGYSSRVHRRTKVTVSDLATKCGTRIDDMRIKGQDLELNGDGPFKIFIGRCPEAFTLEWVDVVLSVDRSILERQGAAQEEGNGGGRNPTNNDAYLSLRGKLEPLDIKLVTEYLPNRTTHVVQATRDSHQWTLEALLGAKYIVDASFIDAITYATTPASVDDPHSHCPLEEDYDGNWPDAMGHVPARDGRGDTTDDGRAFAPDPSRAHCA